jgi:hypothetical protein
VRRVDGVDDDGLCGSKLGAVVGNADFFLRRHKLTTTRDSRYVCNDPFQRRS